MSDATEKRLRAAGLFGGTVSLPLATRQCWDCGVGSGPCQCTPEFAAWEAAREEWEDIEVAARARYERTLLPGKHRALPWDSLGEGARDLYRDAVISERSA